MNTDFQFLAGVALIIFALCAPIAYCTVQRGGPTSGNDLVLECIKARGEWKYKSWIEPYYCEFPKAEKSN